jgi:hypothetical protein
MAITLPKGKVAAETQDPKNLILFGSPKVGKTTLLAELPNSLLVDMEQGSTFISACKVSINSIKEIQELVKAIKDAGNPYKFIVLDTITALAEMVRPLAIKDFLITEDGEKYLAKLKLQGKSEKDINLDLLPFGKGFTLVKEAMSKVIKLFASVCENVIIVGHVKLTQIETETATDITKSLDLAGQAKRYFASQSDAIGYIFRDENSNLVIDFRSDAVECGARPKHLANKVITVCERTEDGEFISHWSRVFPSLKNN